MKMLKGFDDYGFYVEGYTKAEVEALLDARPTLYTGTDEPPTSLGKDGDIYIKTK